VFFNLILARREIHLLEGSQVQIPLGPFMFFNLILARREMYVGMRMSFAGRGNEKCRTRNKNDREWWQNMRIHLCFFNLILARREMYVGMRMSFAGGGMRNAEQGMRMTENGGRT
jgi:hypothetical protein